MTIFQRGAKLKRTSSDGQVGGEYNSRRGGEHQKQVVGGWWVQQICMNKN